MRQELGAEIERARSHMLEEARRRIGEAVTALEARQLEVEKASRQERVDTAMTLDALRDQLVALRHRTEDLERELLVGGGTGDLAAAYSLGGAITPSATVPDAPAEPVTPRPTAPAARR